MTDTNAAQQYSVIFNSYTEYISNTKPTYCSISHVAMEQTYGAGSQFVWPTDPTEVECATQIYVTYNSPANEIGKVIVHTFIEVNEPQLRLRPYDSSGYFDPYGSYFAIQVICGPVSTRIN